MRRWTTFIVLGLTISGGSRLLAAPQPQTASADIQHGQQLVISGSGFGAKSPAAPWLWDNFDDGAIGQVVTGPNWSTYSAYGGELPTYSSDHARVPGGIATKQGPMGNTTLEAAHFPNGCNGGQVYVSGWFWGTQVGGSRSMKFIQLNNGNWGYPEFRTGGDFNWYWSDVYGCTGGHIMANDGIGSNPFQEKWERWEWVGKFDTDGIWRTYRNSQLVADGAGNFSLDNGCCVNSIYLSSYYGTGDPAPAGSQGSWYWDEIYIDDTPARVELGDAATWAACNRREVQIPSAWGANSITVTCNQGGFADGSTAYLYVVDGSGAVNQNGLAVTVGNRGGGGGGGGDSAPVVQVLTPVPSGGNYSVQASPMTQAITGSAGDDVGLSQVTWSNAQTGESGVVVNQSGDWTSWQLQGINLADGANTVQFIARDTANQTASTTITVTLELPAPGAPGKPYVP